MCGQARKANRARNAPRREARRAARKHHAQQRRQSRQQRNQPRALHPALEIKVLIQRQAMQLNRLVEHNPHFSRAAIMETFGENAQKVADYLALAQAIASVPIVPPPPPAGTSGQ